MTEIGELITPTGRLVLPAIGTEIHLDRPDRHAVTRDEWLTARRSQVGVGPCIGASDVPSILGVEGVDTPVHVYRDKALGVERPPNEAMTWGSILEASIAAEWCRRNRSVIDEIGLVARNGAAWARATIDRRVGLCPITRVENVCGLEVKNVGYQSGRRWHSDFPDRIMAQVIFQLWVTGLDHMHIAALIGGNTMVQGVVYADREFSLTTYIAAQVTAFRDTYLIPKIEPPWEGNPDKLIELDRATYGGDRVGDIDLDQIDDVFAYAQQSRIKGDADSELKTIKARLLKHADGNRYVTFANELAYELRPTTRRSPDLERLAERWPDAYADCVSETSYPTLAIAKAYKIPKPKEGKP